MGGQAIFDAFPQLQVRACEKHFKDHFKDMPTTSTCDAQKGKGEVLAKDRAKMHSQGLRVTKRVLQEK